MNDEPQSATVIDAELKGWRAHKFMVLVGATIVVSMILVSVAMAVYSSSGAAQLDLSRPGYQEVRDQADRNEIISAFPATGTLDKRSLSDFRSLYDKQANQVIGYDGFGGTPMSDQALGLELPQPQ